MKNNLLILTLLLCAIGAWGQVPYYGTPFYKEGFDNASLPATNWVQEGISYDNTGGSTPTTTAWSTNGNVTPVNKNFNKADASSTHSLECKIARDYGLVGTITSPEITNKDPFICVGFTVFNTSQAFPLGYGHMSFQASLDGGATWDVLWRSDGKATGFPYKEVSLTEAGVMVFNGWTTVQVNLPAAYDNKNFKLRFHVDSPDVREGTSGMSLLIDGVFASKRRALDVKVNTMTGFDTKTTNKGAYLKVPVTVSFSNEGSSPITSVNFSYNVEPTGQTVTETFTPSSPILSNESASYTFNTPADLSKERTTYTMTVKSLLANDEYPGDDQLSFTIENQMTEVPYTARWWRQPEIDDAWVRIQEGALMNYPFWTYGTYGQDTLIYCDASTKEFDADSYYFSRPVSLRKGKKYELRFNAFTGSDNEEDVTAMQVFMASTLDTLSRIGNDIFYKTDINKSKYLKQTFEITVTRDTAYYFVFRAISKSKSKTLYVSDIGIRETADIDASIDALVTPKDKTLRFSNQETVTVTISNAGMQPIAANTLKVSYRLNQGNIVSETLTKGLAAKESMDYSFSTTADMSALGTYSLKAWVTLPNDKIVANDTIKRTLNSAVTTLPYDGSLGANMSNRTYEEAYWTAENWTASFLGGGTSWFFSGSLVSGKLYSRPIYMEKDQFCEISFLAQRNNTTNIIPLQIGVYTKEGDAFTRVDSITTFDINTARSVYAPYDCFFKAPENGDYYFGFVVQMPSAKNTMAYLTDIYFKVANSHDLVMNRMLLPAEQVSKADSLPIGGIIRNKGRQAASSYTISYQLNDGAAVTETINTSIAADELLVHYFKDKMRYRDTGDETIKMWVTLSGDEDLDNNELQATVKNVDPVAIPYNITSFSSVNDWLSLDENKDGNRWEKFTGTPIGYKYTASANDADDYLLTKNVSLEADKTYKVTFEALAETAGKPFDIGLSYGKSNHTKDLKSIMDYKGIVQTASNKSLIAYFKPEAAGNHVVGFHISGKDNTGVIGNKFSITESAGLPDAAITIVYPDKNDMFKENDSIVIAIKNDGQDVLAGLPLFFKLNGEIVHSTIFYNAINAGETLKYKVEDINMFEPGEYKIEAYTELPFDAVQDNNKAEKTVLTLAKSDVQMIGIIAPVSGKTKSGATVSIRIKNAGNVPITDINVAYSINSSDVNEVITEVVQPNADYEYSFTQKADLSTAGTYSITVSATYVNDEDTDNNTLTQSFQVTDQTVDIAVTEIVSPISGTLTGEETITAIVKNNTPIPLNVPVSYSINGGAKVTEFVEMAASATETYSFTTKADLSEIKTYNIVVTAEFPEDEVAGNNSISTTVEFLQKDLGVSRIMSPTSQFGLSAATAIKVEIKNYGQNPIAQVDASYVIDNGEAVTETVVFPSELEAGAVYSHTFSAKADLSEIKAYTITAYTTLENDIDASNDKAIVTISYMTQEYGDVAKPVQFTSSSGFQRSSLLADGSQFVAYWKMSESKYDLYVQYLDQKGTPQFAGGGLLISNNERTYCIVNTSGVDKEGNYILGFSNLSNMSPTDPNVGGEVRVSKISRSGEYLFGPEGKVIVEKTPNLVPVNSIITDSRGDIYMSCGGTIYKIDQTTGEVIKSISQGASDMRFDNQDNLCVTYTDNGFMMMKIFDTELEAWTLPILISNGSISGASIIVFDTENSIETGIWVCCTTRQYGGTYFVQYLNSDLEPQAGETGVPINTSTATFPHYGWPTVVKEEGKDSYLAIVTSESVNGGVEYSFLKGYIVKRDGELVLGATGKDIVEPAQGTDKRSMGLHYRDGKIYLVHNYYQGSGSLLRTHADVAICDLELNIVESIRIAQSVNDMKRISVYPNEYGIYVTWDASTGGYAQHYYFDNTLANKSLSVKVTSADYTQGYAIGGGLFDANGEAVMRAVPVPGLFFKEWQVDGQAVSSANPYIFPVTKDVTLTAVFAETMEYKIIASAEDNGSIDPEGTSIVNGGSDKTFTMIPDEGYTVEDILVDNKSVGAANSYTFKNITNNHEIKVTFRRLNNIDDAYMAQLRAFPNPTMGPVNITNGESPMHSIRVFDITGRLLLEMKNINHTEVKIDLAPYATGSYFIEVDGKTMKVMKQ